jgi:hypothetical protein
MQPDDSPQTPAAPNPDRFLRLGDAWIELLHVCVECSGKLVHPLDGVEEGPVYWRTLLRCPECENIREGMFPQEAVGLFADELDRGEAVLLGALQRVTMANMTEAAEVFIRALDEDVIVADDFRR